MTILYVVLGLIIWFAFGLIGAGFMFAAIQGEFPELAKDDFRSDIGYACLFGICGPISAIVGLFLSGFGRHGWWVWFKKSNAALSSGPRKD